MEVDLVLLLGLFGVALVASCVDAIAGGGGLLSVPALLAAGLSPAQVLATNKLQSVFGSGTATFFYWRRGLLDLRQMASAIACTFIGALCGAALVQSLDGALMYRILPFLLVAFALFFVCSPSLSDRDRQRRIGPSLFALLIGTGVGFYDGFFGPGTGSFFVIAFVVLAGFSLTRATAHTKLLNWTSNLAALLLFSFGGAVVWKIGLVMACGQLIGARLGSRLVLAKGAGLVRPALVTVSLLMSLRLFWQQYPEYSEPLRLWLQAFAAP